VGAWPTSKSRASRCVEVAQVTRRSRARLGAIGVQRGAAVFQNAVVLSPAHIARLDYSKGVA